MCRGTSTRVPTMTDHTRVAGHCHLNGFDITRFLLTVALYWGENPHTTGREQRSQSLGIESLRRVRDTFAQRRHASQHDSVELEQQRTGRDSHPRELVSENAVTEGAYGELGQASSSESNGDTHPTGTGATVTNQVKEGILRNRKSNKPGESMISVLLFHSYGYFLSQI